MKLRLLLPALCLGSAWAASTTAWEMNNFQDFVQGTFTGVSLSRDGRLMLAPKLETVASTDQPAIWSVVRAADGAIYAGTGHRGNVYRIVKDRAELVWTAPEPEVFAVALDPNGVLYAATSPEGKVYRIENGKGTLYFDPKAKYIWSLAFGKDGALYAGTGDAGKVFRITGQGAGEIYYETGQTHVTSLAVDINGRVLAGTDPNGLLYRIETKGKAFVLYDADFPEIRSLAPQPDGSIYAATLGGSVAKQAQAAQQASQAMPASGSGAVMSITVTADAAAQQQGLEVKPVQDANKSTAQQAQPAVSSQFTPAGDAAGTEKSALYRILPDNTIELLWNSKEENAYDLLVKGDQILFSTDSNGRIYRLSKDRKLTLVTQTNESEAVRLLSEGDAVLAATANLGKLFRLGAGNSASGTYTSPVHDAGTVARWGQLDWDATSSNVVFRTRSGNSARPDNTWSDWSAPVKAPAKIGSPNARYVQWQAEFSGASEVDSVSLSYLPQNSAPRVTNITVSAQPMPAATATKPGATANASTFSVTVSDTGTSNTTPSGTSTQIVAKPNGTQLFLVWQAEDADNDKLVYTVQFRGEGERDWKTLKTDLQDAYHSIDGDVLADGRYVFRVIASDAPANPREQAREHELVSPPVLVDGTPPVVTIGAPRRDASGNYVVEVDAEDKASALRRCEYAIDAGAWVPVSPADGVVDGMKESFVLNIPKPADGEHVLVVRVLDAARNPGLAKVILR